MELLNLVVQNSPFLYLLELSFGQIAQSVEQRTENPCVAGSIPVLATSVEALYVLLLLFPILKKPTIAVVPNFLKFPKISISYCLFEMHFKMSVLLGLLHQNQIPLFFN